MTADSGSDAELAELVESVTPRQRAWISWAGESLAAAATIDVDAFGDRAVPTVEGWVLFDRLPGATWEHDSVWRRRFGRCATDLVADVATIGAPIPRCTADELMLHLILQRARGLADDPVLAGTVADIEANDGDQDWELLSEVLFQDHDVLMLYDGFTPETITAMRGVNIAPNEWFDEFGHHLPVPGRSPSTAN